MGNIKISDLPLSQRPMEKLLKYGADSLGNEELLAILLRTGTKGENVIELSTRLISNLGGLDKILDASYEEIKKIKENIQEIKILGIKTKEKSIDLQFLIKYKNKEYRKDLPIVGFINSTDELEDKQFLECVKDLPQKINIFRIGYSENYREECHSEVKNFWLVTSEWKKIKN